jgi:DNA helicase HerA-like ATPase
LREFAPQTKALIFNVKGEDLLHLDRPNRRFEEKERARADWSALGVSNPGPFNSVRLYAPRSKGRPGLNATDVTSRAQADVTSYGWTPREFVRRGLLEFCFSDREDRRGQNQVSFVEQRVRLKLLKHAFPHPTERGGVILVDSIPQGTPPNFEERQAVAVADGHAFLDFSDLVEFLESKLDPTNGDASWTAGTAQGTQQAFLRRLYAQQQQFGHLITTGVEVIRYDEAVTVVDIHSLQEPAQRFVVGALLSEIFQAKQGRGREPLHFVLLDELNKYAPRDGSSPIKDILVDISARGRSLGVILVGAQQSAGDVDGNIIRNASIKVVGRLDAGEVGEYGFLSPELRQRAARFLPGTMVLDQPLVPAPIPIRFPFPGYATCQDEGLAPDTPEGRARLTSLLSEG